MNMRRRIVLILGAGASSPFGFPLGAQLADELTADNSSDNQMLSRAGWSIQQVQTFRDSLRRSGVESVDQFLETRPELREVGKALLARVLSRYEVESDLYKSGAGRWYKYFFNEFVLNTNEDGRLAQSHVTIVTFNYDRSMEYWLLGAVQERFNVNAKEAVESLKSLSILHLHGTLGGSPLQEPDARAYEEARTPDGLQRCVSSLRIIHEANPNTEEWSRAHKALDVASHVVFLGFGYHPVNIQRLQLAKRCDNRGVGDPIAEYWLNSNGIPRRAKVTGTCFGHTESEISALIVPRLQICDPREWGQSCCLDVLSWMRANTAVLLRPQ